MKGPAGGSSGGGLGSALLGILAAGVAGGTLLIAGAKALGEKLEEKQASDYEKREEQRKADIEEVRRIMKGEEGIE